MTRRPVPNAPRKPTPDEIRAAHGRTLADVLAPGLDVVFCGINPGLYSGAVGHHFARPGNRFWRALHESGFTPRRLTAYEERLLLDYGLGLTNLVERATAAAAELSPAELVEGARRFEAKLLHYNPRYAAFLGIDAYRKAFARRAVALGLQPETIGATRLWLLPNPSGLNAHYRPAALTALFRQLRDALIQQDPKDLSGP